MMLRKINGGMWVLYGYLVSKVLEHLGFNIEDEEFVDYSMSIGNVVVRQMRIKIINGVSS